MSVKLPENAAVTGTDITQEPFAGIAPPVRVTVEPNEEDVVETVPPH